MQLVAYGAQDVYLNATPTTYFSPIYRQHTYYTSNSIHANDNNIDTTSESITEPTIIYKLIDANTECIITYISIEINSTYWECNTCNKVISWDAASLWISSHKKCPHCRCDAVLDTKYINGEKPVEPKLKEKE